MLVEDAQVRGKLEQVVGGLTTDPTLRKDLLQVGLLNLWQVECRFPGQTESWYLQNCRFCALHWLVAGRSIDSVKRSAAGNRLPIQGAENEDEMEEIPDPGNVVDTVSFNDLRTVLSRHLTRRERAVLEGLATGLPLRQIAFETRLSYPTALKYRRRIAALVSKLGIPKPSASGRQPCPWHPAGAAENTAKAA